MLLDKLKNIKLSELILKLNQKNNNKLLLFCYDYDPDTYIIYNLKPETNIKIYSFIHEISKVSWMTETLSDIKADICIIKNIQEFKVSLDTQQLLDTLLNIIKTNKNIKQWILFSSDSNFISNYDNFIQNFEIYKLITDETTSTAADPLNNQGVPFENTTGHTEDTEGLVEGYALFDPTNYVQEDVFQVKFVDGEYKTNINIDLPNIIKDFKVVDEVSLSLKASVGNAQTDKTVIEKIQTGDKKSTIEATLGIVGAVNDFGHYLTRGSICPVCGKYVRYIPSNGFCSLKCAGKYLLAKIQSCLTGEYELETPQIVDKIQNIMDYFNLTFNVISKIPDLLTSIATLPEEYRNYATAKINIIFLDIKKVINLLLIKKNELIIYLLNKINYGVIDEKLKNLFTTINSLIDTANALSERLEESVAAAYKAITKANALLYIGPQEYGFFTTLKSQMCICPYYKTDRYTYPSDQLGRPFWGSGVINIAFDMSLCQISFEYGAKSALKNIDMKKITTAIQKVFKPIKAEEYLMDPDLFDVRLALSDQNQRAIQELTETLSRTMVLGGDFIPDYDNLKLNNIWFIIAILTCWGPWTRAIYGDFIYHAGF